METDNIFVERKRSIKLNVKLLVELYPEVTGNYTLLYQRYVWYFCGIKWFIPFSLLKSLPSPESITRAFRKLKEDGTVQETLKTAARRDEQQQLYRRNSNKL
jgi:hypothetical protein